MDQFEAARIVSEHLYHIKDTYKLESIIDETRYHLEQLRFNRFDW